MKNIVSLIALFFSLISYSQKTFDFNISTIYKVEKGKDLKKSYAEVILSNDSLNVMTVFRNSRNKLVAIIRTKENVNHYFNLINDNDDIINPTNFEYQFSVEFKNSECFTKNFEFEVIKAKDSSSNYNTKVIRYYNRKKNAIHSILYLNNSDSEQKYYTNFKEGYLHHFDSCDKLNIGSNFLVKSAEFQSDSQNVFQKITLIKSEIINLKIRVDKLRYGSIGNTHDFNRF